jgi:molecular chaperone DnaK
MEMTLEDANLEWSQVDKILLVGGSTRMPAVTVLIESVYGKKPSSELHPDEVVAHGAAILATMMMAEDRDEASPGLPNISITDVNSHSLGVVAVHSSTNQPYNSIVLPKDTPIPTKVGNFYVTMVDNQTRLQIEITEGEEESLEFVKVIGCGEMSIPPYPKGAPIEVVFQYSNDGIVFAEVFDRTSDKSVGELKITREANLTQDQLESMRQRIGTTEIQ